VVAAFDQPHASSDGGALLLRAADRRLGLIAALTARLSDPRLPSKVTHAIGDVLAQRVFAIACGHPDGNDADRLAHDPMHKLLLDRDPIDGRRLASQPTISRFEQAATPRTLYGLGEALADTVIRRHQHGQRTARLITIDVDVTADPTQGRNNSPSSTASTTPGATCHWWRRSRSTRNRASIWSRRSCARATSRRRPASRASCGD
jgi:hypothetical protein